MTPKYTLGTVTVAGDRLPAVRDDKGHGIKYQTLKSGLWLDADTITRATFRPNDDER